MFILNTLLYYICFSSAILIYGLGINKSISLSEFLPQKFSAIFKIIFSIFLSSILSWTVMKYILLPLNIIELYPFTTFIIYIIVNTFLENIIRITTGNSTTEFVFSFLLVLLSVSESISLVNSIIICTSCIISFLFLIPLLYSFKIQSSDYDKNKDLFLCKFIFFLAFLLLILSVWDIMWINPEVIK